MTVLRYRRKADRPQHQDLYVACYEPGQPLDELRAVATMADRRAELAEAPLPSGTVLVVRWTNYDADRAAEPEFEVIRAGCYLGYSQEYGLLCEDTAADLRHWYDPVEPAAPDR